MNSQHNQVFIVDSRGVECYLHLEVGCTRLSESDYLYAPVRILFSRRPELSAGLISKSTEKLVSRSGPMTQVKPRDRSCLVRHCVHAAFPNSKVADIEALSGGLTNTNVKIEFSCDRSPVVLRLYRGDASVCVKETAILRLLHSTLPVPDVIYVEPNGIADSGPFCILEFVNGRSFQDLKRVGDVGAIHQAASSVGALLARIEEYQFSKPGQLQIDDENDLIVGEPNQKGPNPIARVLDMFLQSEKLQRRVDGSFRQKLHKFIGPWFERLMSVDNAAHLVHSDFGNRNILVDRVNGNWQVVAVLDWNSHSHAHH